MKRLALALLVLCGAAALALDWREVTAVRIPAGEVASVAVDGEPVWTKPNPLPYDAEVQHIEFNTDGGTAQYIDTLCPVEPDTIVEARWYQTGNAAQQRLFGVNDGSGKRFALYINNSTGWAANMGTSDGVYIRSALGDRQYQGTFDLGTGDVTINTSQTTVSGTPFTSANTIPIGARRNIGRALYADYPATFRLNWFKIRQGDALVRDFVPVRVGQTGYLYDRANPTGGPNGNGLYGNAGTGAFVLGPDK